MDTRDAWLRVSLSDYEGHMSLATVGQAALIADRLGELVEREKPESIALLGCAGGNGLERLDPSVTRRVVAVDVNPAFVGETERRHAGRFEAFQAITARIPDDSAVFEPVRMVYAALLLEYVPLEASVAWMLARLTPGGLLATLVQVPSPGVPTVTPSPYRSLEILGDGFTYRSPEAVTAAAAAHGAAPLESTTSRASGGKDFRLQTFRRHPDLWTPTAPA